MGASAWDSHFVTRFRMTFEISTRSREGDGDRKRSKYRVARSGGGGVCDQQNSTSQTPPATEWTMLAWHVQHAIWYHHMTGSLNISDMEAKSNVPHCWHIGHLPYPLMCQHAYLTAHSHIDTQDSWYCPSAWWGRSRLGNLQAQLINEDKHVKTVYLDKGRLADQRVTNSATLSKWNI